MRNLFVGNMSFQTTEADLTALFQPFGQVGRAVLLSWKCPMTPRQRRPLPLSTEKKWEAATSRSTRRGPRANAPRAAIAADAPVVVAAVADSRMRITGNRLASRANRAGSLTTLDDVSVAPDF